MTDCGTIGSIQRKSFSRFLWTIPEFSSLTDFYRSPDFYHLDDVWNLCIYPSGTYLSPWLTYLQLCRKKGVRAVRFNCMNASFEEAITSDQRFGAGTCLNSGLYPLTEHKVLLKRLKENIPPDELRIMLTIWIDLRTLPKDRNAGNRAELIILDSESEGRSSSDSEEYCAHNDRKDCPSESETKDLSSSDSKEEDCAHNDPKVTDTKRLSREIKKEDVPSDTADREEPREHLDVKSLVSLAQNLKDLYLEERNYDVTITVRNRTFKAHRTVLEARVPVLAGIRPHRLVENSDETICVMDCEPNAFAVFLLFVYSGTVENLSGENVADVFFVADKYALPELREKCVRYMLDSLVTVSICNIIALASRHGERELLERATEFFIENAQDILPTIQWRRFMVEHPDQANELNIKSLAFYASEK